MERVKMVIMRKLMAVDNIHCRPIVGARPTLRDLARITKQEQWAWKKKQKTPFYRTSKDR